MTSSRKIIIKDQFEYFSGILFCVFLFTIPILPDEKLIRLKLQAFEMGIFSMVLLGIIWIIGNSAWRKFTRFHILAGIWFGVTLLLALFSDQRSLANAEIRRASLAMGAFMGIQLLPLSDRWMRKALLSWMSAAGLLSIYAILQFTGGVGPIVVPQMDRVMATYGNPIFFAAFLVPALFITFYLILAERYSAWGVLAFVFFLLEVVALVLSGTRAGWIAVFVGALFGLVIFRTDIKIPKWFWLLVLVAMGSFLILTKNSWSRDQGHLLIWRDTVKMIRHQPLLGVGPGAFHTHFPQYAGDDLKAKWPQGNSIVNYTHNEYLQQLSEVGIVGFLPFMAFVGIFFFLGHQQFKKLNDKNEKLFLGAISMAVVGLLTQNIFSADMRFSISYATLFLLMGIARHPRLGGDPVKTWIPGQAREDVLKYVMVVSFLIVMFGFIFPKLIKPYQAQRKVHSQVGFFEKRVSNVDKTTAELEKAHLNNPNDAPILERLAYVYAKEMKDSSGQINREKAEQAIQAYQKLQDLNPNQMAAVNNLGNVYYTLGRLPEAILEWKKALKINPNFLSGYLNLGKVLYVHGELKDAAQYFEKALQLDPHNAEAQVYLRKMVE